MALPSATKPPHASSPMSWRHVVAVAFSGVVGIAVGALASLLVPPGGFDGAARARHALATDTAAGLSRAVELADGEADLVAVGALARLLLWLDHGAGDDERILAERVLQAAPSTMRTTPEALYARALLASLPTERRPVVDAALAADLKAAPDDDAWTDLARALVSQEAERRRALDRAAFAHGAHPHATHLLARWLLAHDDVTGARAALDHLFRQAPSHARGLVTSMVVAARGDALAGATAPERGTRRPAPARARADEVRARALLDRGLDARDKDTLAFGLWFAAAARGTAVDADVLENARAAAIRSAERAERAIELALLQGDIDLAAALASALSTSTTSPTLLADAARVRFAQALSDEDRRAAVRAGAMNGDRGQGGRGADVDGVLLPLGRLVLPAPTTNDVFFGFPWVARPNPEFFPERRLARWASEGGTADKLPVVEQLALAERALDLGDLDGAHALLEQAGARGRGDDDVVLLQATLSARRGEQRAARAALASLVDADSSPTTWLAAARLALDVDDLVSCRRALNAFFKGGFQSATASALVAELEARGGDLDAAQKALADARRLGVGDDDVAWRATILVGRRRNVADARGAADALLSRGTAGGGDVVGAWIAEAQYRAGQQPRAEAALRAIVTSAPALGEAHLFLARTIAFDAAKRAEALEEATRATELLEEGPLVDEAKALVSTLKRR